MGCGAGNPVQSNRMSPQVYQVIHLLGVLLVFSSYGGLIFSRIAQPDDRRIRKFGAITSGIGLFLILLGGFGLLAKLYNNTWPTWVIVKLVIWVLLGGMIALINRRPQLGTLLYWITIGLGLVAIIMVYIRPV